jgi:hypothetical protein
MVEINLIQAFATAALTLVGGTGIAFINYWLGISKDRKLKQDELTRAGNYLAIRVVCILDAFVDGCVEVVHDDGLPDAEGMMQPRSTAPKLDFPADLDWKTIRHDLMYRALALPNVISAADEAISWAANEISGPPEYEEFFEERTIRYCEIGVKALALGRDLRAQYGIPARELAEHYDPDQRLSERLKKVRALVSAKEEALALSHEQMMEEYARQKAEEGARQKAAATPKDDAAKIGT